MSEQMTPEEAKDMYEKVKRLWMLEHKWDEDEDRVEREFDSFVGYLVNNVVSVQTEEGNTDLVEPPTLSAQLMEFILEIDETLPMVPPRVANYRSLLAAAGLDKQPVTSDEPVTSGGMQGMPGITLADQAALAFHQQLLGIALGIAQDAATEKLKKSQRHSS